METKINPELFFHLKSLTRFIYYVTEEEDRFLKQLADTLKKHEDRTFVFNLGFGGCLTLKDLIEHWRKPTADPGPLLRENARNGESGRNVRDIYEMLDRIYDDNPRDKQNFYVITDPEVWLKDDQVRRRFLNIAHHLFNDEKSVKVVIFVSNRLLLPPKMARYVEVIQDLGPSEEEYTDWLETLAHKMQLPANSKSTARYFKGLTTFEVEAALGQSVVHTRKHPQGKHVDPKFIGEYKRRQLKKTDLLTSVDVSDHSFADLGGLSRFKAWAEATKACWTEEGQKFGLTPPKGVLAVGAWGCGKSQSVKALGSAWRIPVVSLEMGRLRSSGVGESEANVYRAVSIIDSMAPCVVFVDEAEKSFSGHQSSAHSDAGTTSRTIGIISTWLQETKAHVCLALTANSLKTLPVEIVNRLDESFFFDLPGEEERIEIIKVHLLANKQDPSKFQLAELAEASRNMVGREIMKAIRAAFTASFHANKDGLDQDILIAEMRRKPRIIQTMGDELREVLEWVGFDPDTNDGIRAKFASDKRSETFRDFKLSGTKT